MNRKNNTILVVDDVVENLHTIKNLLQNDYNIKLAKSGPKAIEIVKKESPDLIILDILMPEMDGFEVCNILKNDRNTNKIPIIFLTGETDENTIEQAYEIGGVDYVTKPFRPKELMAKVKREFDLITLQNELKLLASIDPMTKLFNRRYLKELFPKLINSAKRNDELVAFLIMDIDHFKMYNDTYGHKMGDEVLIKIASAIRSLLNRADDYSFRLGGEEFAILFKADSFDKAKQFSNNIRMSIERLHIEHSKNSASSYVTASMGLLCKHANDINTYTEIYEAADDLLYSAKETGRNKVVSKEE